jgi:hypothetical protein
MSDHPPFGVPGPPFGATPPPAPGDHGAVVDPGAPWCRVCGGQPAFTGSFMQNIGMIFLRSRVVSAGPYCRDCGLHDGRSAQLKTLITGWWGIISFFFNIGGIVGNARGLSTLRSLPEPQGGDATRRLDPGKPLFLRPALWAMVAVVVLLAAFVLYPRPHKPVSALATSKVGQCIAYQGNDDSPITSCAAAHDGKIVAAVTSIYDCPRSSNTKVKIPGDEYFCVDESL